MKLNFNGQVQKDNSVVIPDLNDIDRRVKKVENLNKSQINDCIHSS